MKWYKLFLALCGLWLLSVPGCKEDSTVSTRVHLGEPFTLKINESVSLPPVSSGIDKPESSLIVKFERVVKDSRCSLPFCYLCYGSLAEIELLVIRKKSSESIFLRIPGCQEEFSSDKLTTYRIDTLGYRFCLLRLDPYLGTSLNSSLYSAKLNISGL